MLIRELPADLRPTNRLRDVGPSAMSSAELLSILIGSGTQNQMPCAWPKPCLQRFDNLRGILQAPTPEICQIHGIGPIKAAKIKAALELGLRLDRAADRQTPNSHAQRRGQHPNARNGTTGNRTNARRLARHQNYVSHIATVYTGSLNAAVVRIGEIFREPVRRLAASIVVVHNHPSGDPTPSPEDVRVTEMIVEAGKCSTSTPRPYGHRPQSLCQSQRARPWF